MMIWFSMHFRGSEGDDTPNPQHTHTWQPPWARVKRSKAASASFHQPRRCFNAERASWRSPWTRCDSVTMATPNTERAECPLKPPPPPNGRKAPLHYTAMTVMSEPALWIKCYARARALLGITVHHSGFITVKPRRQQPFPLTSFTHRWVKTTCHMTKKKMISFLFFLSSLSLLLKGNHLPFHAYFFSIWLNGMCHIYMILRWECPQHRSGSWPYEKRISVMYIPDRFRVSCEVTHWLRREVRAGKWASLADRAERLTYRFFTSKGVQERRRWERRRQGRRKGGGAIWQWSNKTQERGFKKGGL